MLLVWHLSFFLFHIDIHIERVLIKGTQVQNTVILIWSIYSVFPWIEPWYIFKRTNISLKMSSVLDIQNMLKTIRLMNHYPVNNSTISFPCSYQAEIDREGIQSFQALLILFQKALEDFRLQLQEYFIDVL